MNKLEFLISHKKLLNKLKLFTLFITFFCISIFWTWILYSIPSHDYCSYSGSNSTHSFFDAMNKHGNLIGINMVYKKVINTGYIIPCQIVNNKILKLDHIHMDYFLLVYLVIFIDFISIVGIFLIVILYFSDKKYIENIIEKIRIFKEVQPNKLPLEIERELNNV